MTETIESVYEKGVFIPTKKLKIPERSKVILRIEKIKSGDDLKLVSYIKLIERGSGCRRIIRVLMKAL